MKWSVEKEQKLLSLHGSMPLKELSKLLEVTEGSLRGKITSMGIKKKEYWTDDHVNLLVDLYKNSIGNNFIDLESFSKKIGKHKTNICRKAKELGLGTSNNRKKKLVYTLKVSSRRFSEAELKEIRSQNMKKHHANNIHPMLGKKHKTETLEKISKKSKEQWENMSEESKNLRIKNTLLLRGGPPKISRGSWKAQWREIGGKRNFYRSNWEANYACYLQWLKENNQIKDWEHEPVTFWFEGIKRGVVSYKPDFIVIENNGNHAYQEVKGWMDDRSKTSLDRMSRFFPEEKIILIREKEYKSIRKNRNLFAGWIDSARDAR